MPIGRPSFATPPAAVQVLFCSLIVLLFASSILAQTIDVQPGQQISNNIGLGETDVIQFHLEPDQCVSVTVNAQDLRLLMRVIGPEGTLLAEVPHTRYEPLVWNVLATQRGRYQITLSSLEQLPSTIKYEVILGPARQGSPHDRRSAVAAKQFQEVELLRLRSDTPDPTQVRNGYSNSAHAWTREHEWYDATISWQHLAEFYFNKGDYKNALDSFDKALQTALRSGDGILKLNQRVSLGYVYVYQGKLDLAAAIFNECSQALDKFKENPNQRRLTNQLQNNQGEVEYARGNLQDAIQSFTRALSAWKTLGDRRAEAVTHLNLGSSYLDAGSVNEATIAFENALKLSRELGDKRGEALALTAQGNLYTQLGDRYAAATAHRTAKDLFHLIGDLQGEAITSNGLGKVFEDLNRKQEAFDSYSLALRLNHEIGNQDYEGVSAYYLGRVSRDMGEQSRALEFYNQSISLSQKAGKPRMVALASMDIASILVKQQELDQAESIYRRTLRYYEEISDTRRKAIAHHGLGELYRTREQTSEALKENSLSLSLFQQIRDPQGQAESLYWMAWLSQQQGNLTEALSYCEQAIALIEFQRARIVGENWRSSYFASVRRHFELYVSILMELHRAHPDQGFAAKTFEASEQARARSLLELLAQSQSEIRLGVNPDLLSKERQLRQQLSAKAEYQIRMLNSGVSDKLNAEMEAEMRRLNNEYDYVQAEIKTLSPAFGHLVQPAALTLERVQASLREEPERTMLLEFMLGDERSHVWMVTADELTVRELPGRRILEQMAHDVYQSITARQQQHLEGLGNDKELLTRSEGRFCVTAPQLSQLLLGSLNSIQQQPQRLLIAADGNLQYIPFDALPLPSDDGSLPQCKLEQKGAYTPLLTKFETVNLPSFSSLLLLRQLKVSMPATTRRIAVWADPVFEFDDPRIPAGLQKAIPDKEPVTVNIVGHNDNTPNLPPSRLLSTEEEAQSIMRFAPAGLSLLLTGFAATRDSTIKSDLQDYSILHFATHGLVNTRHPALSGILLSTVNEKGQSRDGLLQLHDIFGLRLNADLVVLSGCQTGLGEKLSGEGLIGLTQGFMYAGAKSVVVSLWPVEDKTTATLMAEFYREMFENDLPAAAALRRAKLKMFQTEPARIPYYWSPFVIQGEYRPMTRSWSDRIDTRFIWAGIALVCITSWLSFTYWSRRRSRIA